jgi:hypothetical protein
LTYNPSFDNFENINQKGGKSHMSCGAKHKTNATKKTTAKKTAAKSKTKK